MCEPRHALVWCCTSKQHVGGLEWAFHAFSKGVMVEDESKEAKKSY